MMLVINNKINNKIIKIKIVVEIQLDLYKIVILKKSKNSRLIHTTGPVRRRNSQFKDGVCFKFFIRLIKNKSKIRSPLI